MVALSKLISQSRIFTENEDVHANESGRTNVGQRQVFCFGQELIRGETEFSLKRQEEENY